MARTVADTALMLAAIAGPDPRAPLSYPVDTRTLTRAVRAPRIKGLRVAWGGSLGITAVDDEVLKVCHAATKNAKGLYLGRHWARGAAAEGERPPASARAAKPASTGCRHARIQAGIG